MKKHAIIDTNGIVNNIIVWDGATDWRPPEGMIVVALEDTHCDIGWKYEDGQFVNPIQNEAVVSEPQGDTPPAQ